MKNPEEKDRQRKATCLMNTDFMCVSANLTGGKGSSLALLNTIKGVKVPDFFVVTTAGFKAHFATAVEAKSALQELQKKSDDYWAMPEIERT